MKHAALAFATILFLGHATYALALSDQFQIHQDVIGVDSTPPSSPTGLAATAVASDQIDLDWNASTDNVGVTGYQIFRDDVQIATTTSTSYSDVGLIPVTLYAYTVTAFDGAGNISVKSATSSATTPQVVEPPTGGGHAPVYTVPQLSDLIITTDTYGAHISWRTSIPTRTLLSWGLTGEYELSSLSERALLSAHATQLSGLTPGTTYLFQIVATDSAGNQTTLLRSSFTTVSLPDVEGPENVSDLIARAHGSDADLSWQNPSDSDFDHVRIVRRTDGFPVDPYDGMVVYEGDGRTFTDRDIFASYERSFYTVFAYDHKGNGSSGAVAVAVRPGVTPVLPGEGTSTPPEGFEPLRFSDLSFRQGGKDVSYIGDEVELDGTKPFEVSLPYERLPEHLKTILITLHATVEGEDATFSFLLRVNSDKTAYSAKIAALRASGTYPLDLSLLDYADRSLSSASGRIVVRSGENGVEAVLVPEAGLSWELLGYAGSWKTVSLLALLLLVIYYILKKKLLGSRAASSDGASTQ